MNRTCFLLVCIFAFQCCGIRAPVTKFNGVTLTQSTQEAIALDAEFEISNTNDEPLKLKQYEYVVFAGDRTVYRGIAAAQQTVPRWATIVSTIPIVIRRVDLPQDEQFNWELSGHLSYIPPTALAETLLKSGLSKPTTPIRAHGVIEIPLTN
jgi:hypothetical protein